jgi:hypothetical protein
MISLSGVKPLTPKCKHNAQSRLRSEPLVRPKSEAPIPWHNDPAAVTDSDRLQLTFWPSRNPTSNRVPFGVNNMNRARRRNRIKPCPIQNGGQGGALGKPMLPFVGDGPSANGYQNLATARGRHRDPRECHGVGHRPGCSAPAQQHPRHKTDQKTSAD